jgi:hypothetical protein
MPIWRHVTKRDTFFLPLATAMLISRHMKTRKARAQAHLNDNWKKTIFRENTLKDYGVRWNFFKRQNTFVLLTDIMDGLFMLKTQLTIARDFYSQQNAR